jgi:hypothetical protein
MKQGDRDAGTIAALMIRMQEYRLPRAQRLLEKVNRGETIADDDLDFLKRVYSDSTDLRPLVKRNPEYVKLVGGMIDLYAEITAKALENEKAARGAS